MVTDDRVSGGRERVGVVGPLGFDSFAENIVECLPDIGVQPISLGPAVPTPNGWAGRPVLALRSALDRIDVAYQRQIVERAEREGVSAVIAISALLPQTVRSLRRLGIRVCLWFPDCVANLGRQQFLLGDYDALFFKDPLLTTRLVDVLGLPAHYLPEACNPARHRPPGSVEEKPYVVFAGNMYPSRARLITELIRYGVEVQIYGPPIPRWLRDERLVRRHTGRYVAGVEKAKVFREALAVVNALHPAEMTSVNCRLFEAAACGAVVLCERRPPLESLYEEDREVLGFTTFEELIGRIKWCTGDRPAARSIGDAATVRSHRDHTYQARLTQLLEILW
ncbi:MULTISPECIES: CgeB family protein [Parafrankia]|uniref:CgeB family protein n=1 Tax=Parafrankia TaxID=2994362 RepID=UPI001F61374B|nr:MULTISPECIES: glycosyltransferase [Parafrankia]